VFKKAAIAATLFAMMPAAFAQEHNHEHKPGETHEAVEDDGVGLRGELVYGAKTAKIEVMEYGSFTCPVCARFASEVLPQLKAEYIDTGKVRFIFRNFVRDRYDMAVAAISRCTTSADTAKELTETFFVRQNDWIRTDNPYEAMASIAEEHGIDKEKLGECVSSRSLQEHMVEMRNFGIESYQITHVPTILVNGAVIKGHTYEALKEVLDAAQ
jgi:protein-disulfide isomerase